MLKDRKHPACMRRKQARSEQACSEITRSEIARSEQGRSDQARSEQARRKQARSKQARSEQARGEQARSEQARSEQAWWGPSRQMHARGGPTGRARTYIQNFISNSLISYLLRIKPSSSNLVFEFTICRLKLARKKSIIELNVNSVRRPA